MDALDSENISTIDKILTEFTSQVPQEKWTTKDQELINKVKAHLDALKEKQSIFFLNQLQKLIYLNKAKLIKLENKGIKISECRNNSAASAAEETIKRCRALEESSSY